MPETTEAREGWSKRATGWRHDPSGYSVVWHGNNDRWLGVDQEDRAHPGCCDTDTGASIEYPSLADAQQAIEDVAALETRPTRKTRAPVRSALWAKSNHREERAVGALERIAAAQERMAGALERFAIEAEAAQGTQEFSGRWVRDDGWVVTKGTDTPGYWIALTPDGDRYKDSDLCAWDHADAARECVDLDIAYLGDNRGVAVGWRYET